MVERISERLYSWASILEAETRAQAVRASEMAFIAPHIALMPDAHLGKGASVGSVIPTVGAVMPAAVGVDLGCGMIARRLEVGRADLAGRDLDELRRGIERRVPLSPGRYNRDYHDEGTLARVEALEQREGVDAAEAVAPNWRLQLGSLGGGNHFIEVCLDAADRVWLFLHSGSRGVGNKLATRHIGIARERCRRERLRLADPDPDPDLAWLEEGTGAFDAYLRDLHWAQEFARLNREEMMERVQEAFEEWYAGAGSSPLRADRSVNCHHNYTHREEHFGQEVWLSRKGAIDAGAGVWGLIPGSMGTSSYVVQGLGNELALRSSPHGAGRRLSRTAARRRFTHADLERRMAGISWRNSEAFLDEHPDAYKDVDVVMADAADLVEVRHTLRQVVNVKGE